MLEDKLNQDLKAAMIAGDKPLVSTLRGLKSALLYAKIAANTRDQAMPDSAIIGVLQKEAKKRQESADLYVQGGNKEKAEAELYEKTVIEKYLPSQMSEAEVAAIIEDVIQTIGDASPSQLGQIIGTARQRTNGAADGALIARLVKDRLADK